MVTEKEIKKFHIDQHRHLMTMCGNSDLEKSISSEDFNDKYGVGYEVYTSKNINEFEKALASKIAESPDQEDVLMKEAVSSLQSLEKVFVESGDGTAVSTFYVREKVSEKE